MNRRNFISGTFGGVMAGGILLKPQNMGHALEAVEILKPDAPLIVTPESFILSNPGELVFNHEGKPLGIITQIEYTRQRNEYTSIKDGLRTYEPGLGEVRLTAMCYGSIPTVFARLR